MAELGLAVFATLDLCFKYGKQLVEFCREQRRLERDIENISLVIESVWIKTQFQLDSLKRLWQSDTIEPVLQDHYAKVIETLQVILLAAVSKFSEVYIRNISAASFPKKARAIYLKKDLQKVVNDLEEWQRRFDPSWYLISRIAEPKVDLELERSTQASDPHTLRLSKIRHAIQQSSSESSGSSTSIFVNSDTIGSSLESIPRSTAYLSSFTIDGRLALLDSANFAGDAPSPVKKTHIRDMARLLLNVDPMSFGLLKCEGVVERSSSQDFQFQFIFEVPQGLTSPKSLRNIILEKPQCSLSKRVQLALQLARSVMFVHTTGFVHKNIRPETIIVFTQEGQDLGPSFLIGFEQIRRADSHTNRLGDLNWERNIYRHPVRQGLRLEETFTMQHDIYSLGVCLLELALWHSFVHIENGTTTPWEELDIARYFGEKDARTRGFAVKHQLVALVKDRLPSLVGDRYTDVVLACLRCLDHGDDNIFTSRDAGIKDKDGMIVGVRYIENILSQLEDLHV
ncbi:hypothetical protein PCG10_010730 [Penicillium crustosum]|uniref:Protein kinase domain-containing protein n=1 Tax=Penicillium crustosum TaxID=36656 RepID=A0A9P5KW16_PENCR|nr:hypothetical protein PCG10_010730 [Penicillium crustosum]